MFDRLVQKFYRTRSKYWRDNRMLFPSPAELRFIEIMGGKVLVIKQLRSPKTKFPLAIVLTMGNILNSNLIKREMRVGKYWIDFGTTTPYYKKGIEIDGEAYHKDIVKQIDRDEYFRNYGCEVLHIKAIDVYNNSAKVQKLVLAFLRG